MHRGWKAGFVSCALTGVLASSTAHAQSVSSAADSAAAVPAPPAATPTATMPTPAASPRSPETAAPPPPSTPWAQDYEAAKKLLLDGRFDDAIARFKVLAEYARTPRDAELVTELARLAAEWKSRGTRFVLPRDLADDNAVARRENRRTTDEIAVLYLNGVLYGLGTGAFVAVLTDPKEPAGAILPALALGGAGAGVVALLDSKDTLGYGVPQSIVAGMYLGLAEGVTWTLWNQARVAYYDEWRDKLVATLIWSSATAGAVTGGVLGAVYGTTPGRASYVTSTGLWTGTVVGLLTSAFAAKGDHNDDAALLAGALGLNAGVVGGILSAHAVSPTIARVRFLDLGAIAGGVLAGGVFYSAAGRNPDERALAGTVAVGVGAGFGLSWLLTSKMPQDHPEDDAGTGNSALGLTVAPVPGGLSVGAYGSL